MATAFDPAQLPSPSAERYRQRSQIAAYACTCFTAVVFVGLRVYARAGLIRATGSDDWIIAAAAAVGIAYAATGIAGVAVGVGVVTQEYTIDQMIYVMKTRWIQTLCMWTALFLTKVSILFLYKRILSYTRGTIIVHSLLALVVTHFIFAIVTSVIFCLPVHANWDPTFAQPKCLSMDWVYVVTELHMALDFTIVSIPLPMVISLQMTKRKKRAVYLVFSLGYLICIISLVRLILIVQIAKLLAQGKLFNTVTVGICTTVELQCGIAIACLMTFRPIMRKWFDGWDLSNYSFGGSKRIKAHSGGPAYSGTNRSELRKTSRTITAQEEDLNDVELMLREYEKTRLENRPYAGTSNGGPKGGSWLIDEGSSTSDGRY